MKRKATATENGDDEVAPTAKKGRGQGGLQSEEEVPAPAKKPRGRPKGSKNKPKEPTSKSDVTREDILARATRAADPSINFSDGREDQCNICDFRFDDPIKKKKIIVNCLVCNSRVHKMCLQKNPCRNCE